MLPSQAQEPPRPSLELARATRFDAYHVTDAALSGGIERVPHVVAEAVAGGVGAVQIRDKHGSDAQVAALVTACRDIIRGRLGSDVAAQVALFVNDRLGVARDLGVHLHLGQSDHPVREARAALGDELMIGLSTTTPEQVGAALSDGSADVLGVGPVRATATKPDAAAALGLEGLARCVAVRDAAGLGATAPRIVAIGGIDASIAEAVAATGVDGLCAVSDIAAARSPREAAARLVAAFAHGHRAAAARPQDPSRRDGGPTTHDLGQDVPGEDETRR